MVGKVLKYGEYDILVVGVVPFYSQVPNKHGAMLVFMIIFTPQPRLFVTAMFIIISLNVPNWRRRNYGPAQSTKLFSVKGQRIYHSFPTYPF